MLAQLLWWTTNALEGLLLIRSIRGGFFGRYAFFYLYLSYVFLESLVRFYVYIFAPNSYQGFYWYTQFFSVALGYGVMWEIFRQALERYPGAARMARSVLAGLFVVALSKTLLNALTGPAWSPVTTTAELERNLRTVQAILLATILVLFIYYTIPAGRNLKGMVLGYGFFIGTSIINLTLISHLGSQFQPWWRYLPAMTYSVTLLIWCFTLWSYQPNPQPDSDVGIERDYELVAARTARLLTQVRAHVVRAIRP